MSNTNMSSIHQTDGVMCNVCYRMTLIWSPSDHICEVEVLKDELLYRLIVQKQSAGAAEPEHMVSWLRMNK